MRCWRTCRRPMRPPAWICGTRTERLSGGALSSERARAGDGELGGDFVAQSLEVSVAHVARTEAAGELPLLVRRGRRRRAFALDDRERVHGYQRAEAQAMVLQRGRDLGDAADVGVAAEAPGADERPREILQRIRHFRELPVEDGDEAALVNGEVAHAEVSVADDGLALEREAPATPRDPVLDCGVRL